MIVRRVFDPKRIGQIVSFGARFHKESVLRDLPFSRKRCEVVLKQSFASTEHAVWCALEGDEVNGVLIGALCAYPFFEATYATDLAFCADAHGAKLFHEFEQWARSHGANALQMGVTSGITGADDFYRAAGLIQVGGIYFKRL